MLSMPAGAIEARPAVGAGVVKHKLSMPAGAIEAAATRPRPNFSPELSMPAGAIEADLLPETRALLLAFQCLLVRLRRMPSRCAALFFPTFNACWCD